MSIPFSKYILKLLYLAKIMIINLRYIASNASLIMSLFMGYPCSINVGIVNYCFSPNSEASDI